MNAKVFKEFAWLKQISVVRSIRLIGTRRGESNRRIGFTELLTTEGEYVILQMQGQHDFALLLRAEVAVVDRAKLARILLKRYNVGEYQCV